MFYNKVLLAGNIGKDPEIRELSNGKMASLSLAYTEKWKSKTGEKKESTDWFNLVAFGPVADIIDKYINKGDNVFVEGKQKNNNYEKNGQKVYSNQIVIDSIRKVNFSEAAPQQYTQNDKPAGHPISIKQESSSDDSDVPF
jgi:single-strand DNA-binding protein